MTNPIVTPAASYLARVTAPIALLAVMLAPTFAISEEIDFNRDIRPLLSNHCYQCHGPDEMHRAADLRLDDRAGIEQSFAAGNLEDSEAWQRIMSEDPEYRMPPPGANKEIAADDVQLIRLWIEQGAQWQGHWSFEPIRRPDLPAADETAWSDSAIDRFVLNRMRAAGLSPSPHAERERLIRRLTFDLTGLPPTLAEIDAFVQDDSPNAYDKLVDRLLASERFGERMALDWMDAARYGDSSVFHADGPRDMWPWRDWVIRSFNNNMPFDQFTVEQLAGDLLPNPTWEQLTASGFNRNHGTTDEGGAIDEEYRVEYIVDRIKTTATVWMGLTMECAQCHDHKYDPISQEDYYRFFAFFNQSTDKGMQTRNGNAEPKIDIPNELNAPRLALARSELAETKQRIASHVEAQQPQIEEWISEQERLTESSSPLPEGQIGHWPLDATSGLDVVNAQVQEGQDSLAGGKVVGKADWQAGKIGGGLQIDSSTYVDLGQFADFERTDAFSYGCWVKGVNGAPIAKMKVGNSYRGFDLHLANGTVQVHLIHQWPGNAIKVKSKKPISGDQWHHVFVTYDGSSKAAGVKIYVDGQLRAWDKEQDGLTETMRTESVLMLGKRDGGQQFTGLVDDVRIFSRELTAEEVTSIFDANVITEILALEPQSRTPAQRETLQNHYLTRIDTTFQKLTAARSRLEKRVEELAKPLSSVMVMRDRPEARMTYILERGNYASPRDDQPVTAGTISVLPPMAEAAPGNRLGMAQWLVSPDHPLTSRVTVNRFWQMLFGTGLVETSEDFGAQGAAPTHPELLDWLADDFVSHGWDVKRTLKNIVMSQTYRQSSRVSPQSLAIDPTNRLLSRGPRFRLPGEFIRDQALSISGLLVERLGGPSVKPYQPPGLWNEVSLSGNVRFVQDHGSKLYRRSMYTYWKRSAPAPALTIFDTPTRESCIVRRSRTNTPLQALVTLNDVQFNEAYRMLAERLLGSANRLEDQITVGYRMATGVAPPPRTLQVLVDAFHEELAHFRNHPDAAKELLAHGEYPRDASLPMAEHAAMTIVASLIMNLDECLTKN